MLPFILQRQSLKFVSWLSRTYWIKSLFWKPERYSPLKKAFCFNIIGIILLKSKPHTQVKFNNIVKKICNAVIYWDWDVFSCSFISNGLVKATSLLNNGCFPKQYALNSFCIIGRSTPKVRRTILNSRLLLISVICTLSLFLV